jgi:hypothetical protein
MDQVKGYLSHLKNSVFIQGFILAGIPYAQVDGRVGIARLMLYTHDSVVSVNGWGDQGIQLNRVVPSIENHTMYRLVSISHTRILDKKGEISWVEYGMTRRSEVRLSDSESAAGFMEHPPFNEIIPLREASIGRPFCTVGILHDVSRRFDVPHDGSTYEFRVATIIDMEGITATIPMSGQILRAMSMPIGSTIILASILLSNQSGYISIRPTLSTFVILSPRTILYQDIHSPFNISLLHGIPVQTDWLRHPDDGPYVLLSKCYIRLKTSDITTVDEDEVISFRASFIVSEDPSLPGVTIESFDVISINHYTELLSNRDNHISILKCLTGDQMDPLYEAEKAVVERVVEKDIVNGTTFSVLLKVAKKMVLIVAMRRNL